MKLALKILLFPVWLALVMVVRMLGFLSSPILVVSHALTGHPRFMRRRPYRTYR